MVKLVHSPTLIILLPKLPQHLPLTKIKATIIFLQIPSQKAKYFSSLTHFTQIRTLPSSKLKICLLFLLCILMLYRAWICIRRNKLLQGTWRSLFGVNMFPVFIVEWHHELLMWVVFRREMNYSEEGVCIIISLSISQVIIEYFQIITHPFNMLQYRQFLNQSRTVRNSRPTGSGPSNRNINIEDLVSKPGYGEIFYSEDHKQPLVQQDPNVEVKSQHSKDNLNLRDSLQKEKNLNREMVGYMEELEEENQLLKRKLMEVLGKAENSQVYIPNDLNINGRLSEDYEGSNTISRNLTSGAIPTQHRPPSPVTDPSQNSIGTPAEQVPTFPLNSGSFRPTKLSRGGEQEEYVARRPVQSMPLPYQSAPMQAQVYADVSQPVRGRVYNRSNEKSELMHLAMAKFEEIKDQDEQLRLFTLRLLKKQR